MFKLCLTGGPCGGKSTAIKYIKEYLTENGFQVFVCPETATELIESGIKPNNHLSVFEFQKIVATRQLTKESFYENLAYKSKSSDKLVIICDRGFNDQMAYIDKKEFKCILNEIGLTLEEALTRYDAVFHLTTAANGATQFYEWNKDEKSTCNNKARSESPEDAIDKDNSTLKAWIGHPHLRVFDNSTNFEGKIERIKKELAVLVGIPEPTETEKKFLIAKPSEKELSALGCIAKTHIIQFYLKSDSLSIERRLRMRGTDEDGFSYYYTEKTDIGYGKREEKECRIDKDKFLKLLTEMDPNFVPIIKERHYFLFDNRYFEMDYYSRGIDERYAVLEVELTDINDSVQNMPPLHIIKEITNDNSLRNKEIAKINLRKKRC